MTIAVGAHLGDCLEALLGYDPAGDLLWMEIIEHDAERFPWVFVHEGDCAERDFGTPPSIVRTKNGPFECAFAGSEVDTELVL